MGRHPKTECKLAASTNQEEIRHETRETANNAYGKSGCGEDRLGTVNKSDTDVGLGKDLTCERSEG